jgi:hypothetical protein
MKKLGFYTLMYFDSGEQRRITGKEYKSEERLDLYVRGACLLDKSLKINGFLGLNLLTNDQNAIKSSLQRIGYEGLEITEIKFDLDVPKGIPFYSAHYKIDVFRYFSTKSNDEYSILLDSDIVCFDKFREEFYALVDSGTPMVYYIQEYVNISERKMDDVRKVVSDLSWMPWCGGEFIGGTATFYGNLYNEIISFKSDYWKNISTLFHVGDEFLTSIAIERLKRRGCYIMDANQINVIHRYWSIYEKNSYKSYKKPLIHFPGDKYFFAKVDLSKPTLKQLMFGYYIFHKMKLLVEGIRKLLK